MKITSLATVSLFVLSTALSACSSSSNSGGGSDQSTYSAVFDADGDVTKDSEFGVWEIEGAADSDGIVADVRLKLQESNVILAVRCTYEDTVVFAGVTSSATVGDGEITIDKSGNDEQQLKVDGKNGYCRATISKGKGTYSVKGTTLTLLEQKWTKVADAE